jgi:glutamate-1-semialdehyde 2,1-aminomutase
MTGFRVAYSGAQSLYQVTPDLTCIGKIVGGGLPAAAYGGRRDVMSFVSPSGPVYQAGTLSGNPLAMAAGAAQLTLLGEPGVYDQLEQRGAVLAEGIRSSAAASNVPIYQTRVGSMFCTFFTETPVTDEATAKRSKTRAYATFFRTMLEAGVYLAPSQFEAGFLSLAHTEEHIARTVDAARGAFSQVASQTTDR